jgi:deoxyribodipyrimidine photo-lyase
MQPRALIWLRRDLRLHDLRALKEATLAGFEVAVVFVFDRSILDALEDREDRRVTFIFESVLEIKRELRKQGSDLFWAHGFPEEQIPKLAQSLGASAVFAHHDYEPQAKTRDQRVAQALKSLGIDFRTFKDQVIFEGKEVQTKSATAFKVFTPYKNAWLAQVTAGDVQEHLAGHPKFTPASAHTPVSLTLESMGFKPASLWLKPGSSGARERLSAFLESGVHAYKDRRDFPAVAGGTSGLSVHLRFGTLSIRECVRAARARMGLGAMTWLSELIWREFYMMILDQFPHVTTSAFKPEYNKIKWQGTEEHFQAWCLGETGYPIVDAAMRHFNATGWMHNRLRMIVASFLTKDLLVDWRKGEAYFAKKLLDFDLSANNGGWQWAASTGCDAQPYFRIFNPVSQSEKFDTEARFILSVLPELKALPTKNIHSPWEAGLFSRSHGYPAPIVDHAEQRKRALQMYSVVKRDA